MTDQEKIEKLKEAVFLLTEIVAVSEAMDRRKNGDDGKWYDLIEYMMAPIRKILEDV